MVNALAHAEQHVPSRSGWTDAPNDAAHAGKVTAFGCARIIVRMCASKRRVLVTGGNGFLGKHVVQRLRETGYREVAAPTHHEYDLLDPAQVRQMFTDTQPDVVIHLAARVGGIGSNLARPAEFFYDNLVMGVHLMHAAWKAGTSKFVAVGTVCAYPKHTPVPFREDDLWNGYPEETNAPYGIAKKMLLVQAQAYRQQYGYNAIFLLPVNLYGPGDDFDLERSHVIPALIRKFSDARDSGQSRVILWGDGTPTREFLYVAEAARAIVMATESYDDPDPVNIGAHFEISIGDLAEKIAKLTRFNGVVEWDTSKPNGQPRRKLDTTRALERFGFRAEMTFEEGLGATIEWYERVSLGARSPTGSDWQSG